MVITEIRLIIFFCSQRWRCSVQSAKTRLGADCGSDHELLIAKLRFKLKKVGKTTRPFRYDLNQIHYNYIVEVTSTFKELDLIDRVPEKLWTEACNSVWEAVIKTTPRKRNVLLKCCTQYASKFGKLNSGHRTGKGQFLFQSQRKAMAKNVQTTTQLHSSQMLAKWCSKFSKLGFNSMWTKNFQMFKMDLEKAEEPEIKLPTSVGS